jgi:hypothetical protein
MTNDKKDLILSFNELILLRRFTKIAQLNVKSSEISIFTIGFYLNPLLNVQNLLYNIALNHLTVSNTYVLPKITGLRENKDISKLNFFFKKKFNLDLADEMY